MMRPYAETSNLIIVLSRSISMIEVCRFRRAYHLNSKQDFQTTSHTLFPPQLTDLLQQFLYPHYLSNMADVGTMNDSATMLPTVDLKTAQHTEQQLQPPKEQHYKNWPNAGAVSQRPGRAISLPLTHPVQRSR